MLLSVSETEVPKSTIDAGLSGTGIEVCIDDLQTTICRETVGDAIMDRLYIHIPEPVAIGIRTFDSSKYTAAGVTLFGRGVEYARNKFCDEDEFIPAAQLTYEAICDEIMDQAGSDQTIVSDELAVLVQDIDFDDATLATNRSNDDDHLVAKILAETFYHNRYMFYSQIHDVLDPVRGDYQKYVWDGLTRRTLKDPLQFRMQMGLQRVKRFKSNYECSVYTFDIVQVLASVAELGIIELRYKSILPRWNSTIGVFTDVYGTTRIIEANSDLACTIDLIIMEWCLAKGINNTKECSMSIHGSAVLFTVRSADIELTERYDICVGLLFNPSLIALSGL